MTDLPAPAASQAEQSIRLLRRTIVIGSGSLAILGLLGLWADGRGWFGLSSTERSAAWLFVGLMVFEVVFFGLVKRWPEKPFVEARLAPPQVRRQRTLLMFGAGLVILALVGLQVASERGLLDPRVGPLLTLVGLVVVAGLTLGLARLNRAPGQP